MSWIKLDDQIAHHPKVASAGVSTWLWVVCIGYARKFLTDGYIPDGCVATLSAGVKKPRKHLDKLVKCGLMDKVDGGYKVHDYLHFNDSAEVVKERREIDRVRKMSERNPSENHSRTSSGVLARASATSTTTTTATHPEEVEVVKGNGKKKGSKPRLQAERFTVMDWMHGQLLAILGTDAAAFDVDGWYRAIDAKLSQNGTIDTSWPWLKNQLLREARNRGLILDSANDIAARTPTIPAFIGTTPQTPAEQIAARERAKREKQHGPRIR